MDPEPAIVPTSDYDIIYLRRESIDKYNPDSKPPVQHSRMERVYRSLGLKV